MKELDGPDSQADAALNCYRTALRDLRVNLVVTSPEFKRTVQSRLDRLIAAVSRKTSNEILEATGSRLSEILADYRQSEERTFEHEQLQLRKTIAALETLVRSIARQDDEHSANLGLVLAGLEDTLFEGDLLAIHRNLQEQIRRLRACVVAVAEDAQGREAELEEQIGCLRAAAEQRSSPAAGFADQQQVETGGVLNGYLEECTLFSLILIKLQDLPEITQHWGASCRTRLLSAIEGRLHASMGTLDHLHPWIDGEFVVIVRSTLPRASERGGKLRDLVSGIWNLEMPFGCARIEARCSVGVVEYMPGEDLPTLLARAHAAAAGLAIRPQSQS